MEPKRLYSLDVFRGITIFWMILANNPGSWNHVYPCLRHADWNGWTLTDLVFPFFLFIVGVALTFSLSSRRASSDKPALIWKIVRRSALLFALGLLIDLFPKFHFASIRIPGVLQRIAVCYLLAALLFMGMRVRGLAVMVILLLGGYWLAMKLIPVPGYGAGLLTPQGNLAAFIDRTVFHGTRLYQGTWDPEGLLSTLPALATTLLGVLAGYGLRSRFSARMKLGGLVGSGCALTLLGLWLDRFFPINKNLWSPPFVLFTAGIALLLFALCYWLSEMKNWRGWTWPFVFLGANAITVYVLSELTSAMLYALQVHSHGKAACIWEWTYWHLFASWAGPLSGSLLIALLYVIMWIGIMGVLYWRRIFIKL